MLRFHALSALQEDYYRNFSFDKVTGITALRELEKALAARKEEMRLGREREAKLAERIGFLEKLLKDKDQDLSALLRTELASYEEKLEKLTQEKDQLQKKAESLEEYIQFLSPEEERAEDSGAEEERTGISEKGQEEDQELISRILPLLMTRRLLFLGGGADLLARLRRQFPSAVFVESETGQASLARIDYLVIFARHMSHALFYKYIETARNEDIPVIYCNNANYEKVLRTICLGVQGAEEGGYDPESEAE